MRRVVLGLSTSVRRSGWALVCLVLVAACEPSSTADVADDAGTFEPVPEPVIVDYTTCGVTRVNPPTVLDENADDDTCAEAVVTIAASAEAIRAEHQACEVDADCAIVTFGHGCGDSVDTAVGIGRCDAVNVDDACAFLAALEAAEPSLCGQAFPGGCVDSAPCTTTAARCDDGVCVAIDDGDGDGDDGDVP